MILKVLTFGIAKEICGGSVVTLELTDNVTSATLKQVLLHAYPSLARLTSFAVAVNGEYATADTPVHAGDEVAIIPPVSGG